MNSKDPAKETFIVSGVCCIQNKEKSGLKWYFRQAALQSLVY